MSHNECVWTFWSQISNNAPWFVFSHLTYGWKARPLWVFLSLKWNSWTKFWPTHTVYVLLTHTCTHDCLCEWESDFWKGQERRHVYLIRICSSIYSILGNTIILIVMSSRGFFLWSPFYMICTSVCSWIIIRFSHKTHANGKCPKSTYKLSKVSLKMKPWFYFLRWENWKHW